MIHTNNQPSPLQQGPTLTTLNYRNAALQYFSYSSKPSLFASMVGFFPETHHFLASTALTSSHRLDGWVVALQGSRRYHYGKWEQGVPHGLSLFRVESVVVLTEYKRGRIAEKGRVFVLLEGLNLAVVVEVGTQGWKLVERAEVYCQEHVRRMVDRCGFPYVENYYSLVRFTNSYMNSDQEIGPKITMTNEGEHYKYGYGQGLAVVFDDATEVVQVGWLRGRGQKRLNLRNRRDEGSPSKVGKVYNRTEVGRESFRNEVMADPTAEYFGYFEGLVDRKFVKYVSSGLIKTASPPKGTTEPEPVITVHSPAPIEHRQRKEAKPNRSTRVNRVQTEPHVFFEDESLSKQMGESYTANLDKGRLFEKLPEQRKLQIMKNELYSKLVNKAETPYFASQHEMPKPTEPIQAQYDSRASRDVEGSRFVRSPHIESSPELIRASLGNSRSRRRIFNANSRSPERRSREDTLELSYSPERGSMSRSRRRIFDSGVSSLGRGQMYQSQPQVMVNQSKGRREESVEEDSTLRRRSRENNVQVESRLSQAEGGFVYESVPEDQRKIPFSHTAAKTMMSLRRNNEVYLPARSTHTDPPAHSKDVPLVYTPTNQPYRSKDPTTISPRPRRRDESPRYQRPSADDYLTPQSYLGQPRTHTYF